MGYCQDLAVPASLDCYITALTLGSDYDVVAKAVNSQNVWGPSAAAVENPIDAQSFERPTSPEPLEGPESTDEPLAPGGTTPAPSPERLTAPRAPLAKSIVTNLRVRAVKQGRARGKHTVVVRAKVRPAAGRVVHLQRKICTTQRDQRMCVWQTVGQRRARPADQGVVLVRSKRPIRKVAAWRVFLPGTATALPAVSRTVRR